MIISIIKGKDMLKIFSDCFFTASRMDGFIEATEKGDWRLHPRHNPFSQKIGNRRKPFLPSNRKASW